ncbi:MAG: lysozyme inhibitor LprI family protein [Pseudomonadota bacterium]
MKKVLIIIFLSTLYVFGTSFDCTKTHSNVEKMICSDEELSKLDENLSKAFKEAIKSTEHKDQLKKEQFSWIRERNKCSNIECLVSSYQSRINSLKVDNDNCCLILRMDDTKGQNVTYYELSALKYGDLVVYQNGYGKYFLEQYSTNKSLIELAESIKIKKYKDNYYVIVVPMQEKINDLKIYRYSNGKLIPCM